MNTLLERLAELERTCVKHRLGSATIETAQLSALLRVCESAAKWNSAKGGIKGRAAGTDLILALRALEAPRG